MNAYKRFISRGVAIVTVFAMATLVLGARRSDGACGMNPRRVEGIDEDIGGTLRFDRTSTTTHSVGRSLFYEPGVFSDPPHEALSWYGDDFSRLVVFEEALPVGGGRISTGRFAIYDWGTQSVGGVPLVGLVTPSLDFPARTIRSVDVGLCSQQAAWTSSDGCGIADRLLREASQSGFHLPAPFPSPPIPPLESCAMTVALVGRSGGRWSVELGTRSSTPTRTDDRFCVELPLKFETTASCFFPFPYFVGCVYDQMEAHVCGRFGTRDVGGGHRDPTFTIASFDFAMGPGRSHELLACAVPAEAGWMEGILRDRVRDTVSSAINEALASSAWQREFALPGSRIPGTCESRAGALFDSSGCATPRPGWTADQECRAFLIGDPDSQDIRATCEARRTSTICHQNSDCGLSRSLRTCDARNRCGGELSGALCNRDVDCNLHQPPEPVHCLPVGVCVDSEPVCYWNAEIDRIETMPTGLEIVLAEDASDATYRTFSASDGRLVPIRLARVCRSDPPVEFIGVTAAGLLGSYEGAVVP